MRSKLTTGLSWRAAQAQNEDPVARARGGSIGVVRRGQTSVEMEQTAFDLAPGEIAPVIASRFGFHIVRRPLLASVREEFRAAVEPMFTADLDSLHIRELAHQRHLVLNPAGLERARAAVREPLRHLESRSVIATFDGGRFTQTDVVRWLRTISDWMHTELERGDDQRLLVFLQRMMGYELLYLEALKHGVTLSPLEFGELKEDLARDLDRLKAALRVYLPGPGDSKSTEQRRQHAAQRVDEYVRTLASDWERFAGVPMPLAERLKRTSKWAVYPRRFERVIERAAELRDVAR